MTRDEAIKTIDANWPTENYTMLREALTMAKDALRAPAVTGEANAEMLLRREWWIGHGHGMAVLYGDDGEMQCHECRVWDYRRAPLAELQEQVREARIAKLAAAPPAAGAPPALVELVQRQAELLGQCEAFIAEQFAADDGDSVALSNSICAIRKTLESAVRHGSPAPAPVAPPAGETR